MSIRTFSWGRPATLAASTFAALLLAMTGCDDEPIQVGQGFESAEEDPNAPPEGGGDGSDPGQDVGADAGAAAPSYRDEDFVEAETNRDPFRNYASAFQVTTQLGDSGGREVVMRDTGIDEMRLIGIVSGVSNPRAMLVDRDGVGHVVRRGMYLGRSEVVQAGGTEELPVTLNWRVDRIRPGEVVLTREDPTAPNRPPLTRVIPLREEDDEISTEGLLRR